MMSASAARPLVIVASVLAIVLGTGLGVASADSAPADPANPTTPPTVSADALPTVQIDGVAWDQEVVGNTVYVAGRFNNARPAGAASGTQQTTRRNLLAYDIRTGNLITSFAPDLNAQALTLVASPDGSRIYVGGDFTTANGQTRNRIAAYDTATGQLIASFRPSVYGAVRALAATSSTVYAGGSFTSIGGGLARKNLAAFNAADGVALSWAPTTGEGTNANGSTARSSAVLGIVVVPAANRVIAVGRFARLNATAATGVGALDAGSGATLPFAINSILRNRGDDSAIYSISTDGTYVYGTAYDYYGPGNIEGVFAARVSDGAVRWIADCNGDHYQAARIGSVVYAASHAHNCSRMGGFPETNPRTHHNATAMSNEPTRSNSGGAFNGLPAPTLQQWDPAFAVGTVTGQNQGPWAVTGNSQYVVYGGEFPRVNNVAQAGLVRFAVASLAPNKRGPAASDGLIPTLSNPSFGVARVTWRTTSDPDNENLTYRVVRNGNTAAPVSVTTVRSTFWNTPNQTFNDTNLPGGTYTYQIYAVDPFGNQVNGASRTITVNGPAGTPNQAPTAAFTSTTSGLTASFNGSGSTDSDGTVTGYAWTFGDGGTASGVTASRTYAAAGTYSVQLRVTDDDGASAVVTRSVTVGAAPGGALATDPFARSVSGGLGSAPTGGPWSVSPAAASSVNGNAAILSTSVGATVNAALNSTSSANTAVQVSVSLDRAATGSGNYVSVLARRVGNDDYRVRLRFYADGSVDASVGRSIGGVFTAIQRFVISGLSYAPGQVLNVRFDVSGAGTTTLRSKVWVAGSAEPGWQLTATDSTASLQGAGAVGIGSYVSGSSTNGPVGVVFDNFWAGASGAAPPA